MDQQGDQVMGFSHEKTTHHFELNRDGGVIEVRANSATDVKSRDQIRAHFKHIARMFAAGNFQAPMLVHGHEVPGAATMTKLRADIRYNLRETPQGARIVIATSNQEAREAVHEFLRFQISDHKTGDSTAIH